MKLDGDDDRAAATLRDVVLGTADRGRNAKRLELFQKALTAVDAFVRRRPLRILRPPQRDPFPLTD